MARIAAALGIPKASLADSQQMIEGLLAEESEPWSVQVDLVESDGGQTINLRDASGIFLKIPPSKLDREEGEPREEGSLSDKDGSPKGGGSPGGSSGDLSTFRNSRGVRRGGNSACSRGGAGEMANQWILRR